MLFAARLPQVRSEACISLQASWEQVNSSNCPNHVRRTKSSIKKQIIVRRTVQNMFSEQTFAQLRTVFSPNITWARGSNAPRITNLVRLRKVLIITLINLLMVQVTPWWDYIKMWNATAEWVQRMFCEMQLQNFISAGWHVYYSYVIMLQWNLGNKHIFVEDMVVHYSPRFLFQNGEESEGEPTTVSLVYWYIWVNIVTLASAEKRDTLRMYADHHLAVACPFHL